MWIADRKKGDDVLALIDAVALSGRSGIELATLLSRVSLRSIRVEKLLRKHTDYFIRVGSVDKFTINRFGKLRGSVEHIVADVEQSCKQNEKRRNMSFILTTLVGLLLSVIGFMSLD